MKEVELLLNEQMPIDDRAHFEQLVYNLFGQLILDLIYLMWPQNMLESLRNWSRVFVMVEADEPGIVD